MIQKSDSHRCFPKLWALLQTVGTVPNWKGHTQVSSPGTTTGQILLKQPSVVLVGVDHSMEGEDSNSNGPPPASPQLLWVSTTMSTALAVHSPGLIS